MAVARTRGRRERDVEEAAPTNDIYTGLLLISLAAMIIGCVMLYLDYSQYGDKPPELPKAAAPSTAAPTAPTTPTAPAVPPRPRGQPARPPAGGQQPPGR